MKIDEVMPILEQIEIGGSITLGIKYKQDKLYKGKKTYNKEGSAITETIECVYIVKYLNLVRVNGEYFIIAEAINVELVPKGTRANINIQDVKYIQKGATE